jgi:hypothetical protein
MLGDVVVGEADVLVVVVGLDGEAVEAEEVSLEVAGAEDIDGEPPVPEALLPDATQQLGDAGKAGVPGHRLLGELPGDHAEGQGAGRDVTHLVRHQGSKAGLSGDVGVHSGLSSPVGARAWR